MGEKLGKKEMPAGYGPDDFKYKGRPAVEQDDFGADVGIADGACVNQFGDANNSKFYHAGVLQSGDGKWWCYFEFGRIEGGKTWEGGVCKRGITFQFTQCSSEADARADFEKQMRSKNTKRLVQKGKIWVSKTDSKGKSKDGYIVQRMATRERGLPDAYTIKDDSGVDKKATKKKAKKTVKRKKIDAQPQVVALAKALVGGTADYARAKATESGITPTMDAINEVRDDLIPQALKILQKIGDDEAKQLKSKPLQELSKYVATIVPRPIPRSGDASAILLSQGNLLLVQQDLDAFEAALKNEDFEIEDQKDDTIDPNKVLDANIEWLDVAEGRGKWVADTFQAMSNDRHGHLRGRWKVHNVFAVERPRVDNLFLKEVKKVAKARAGQRYAKARLQPRERSDVSDISDWYEDANGFLAIHGTRSVNIAPILQTNFRMPKALKGVHITGAAFGAGWYGATDKKKSAGYCSSPKSLYSGSSGAIRGRGAFMFLCDALMGKPYMAKTTMWSVPSCPPGYDSIAAYPEHTSVQNDEHVLFDANRQRIRYLVEVSF